MTVVVEGEPVEGVQQRGVHDNKLTQSA